MSSLRKRLGRLAGTIPVNARRGDRGSILILAALSAIIIIGSAGLAVDVSRMYAARAELSRAVDSAALAGVLDFDGTNSGLTTAQATAQDYLTANEPAATASVVADGATNKVTINASKSVKLYFLSLFGYNSASVYGHAVAGFQNQTIDAAMVVDSTFSMSGAPITNAKTAATNFKNTLLGSSPSGNVYVGIAPLRGCYRPTPITYSDCVYNTVQSGTTHVQGLTSNNNALDSAIAAVSPGGLSATNVCTGLGKGYEVISGASPYPEGHDANEKNRQYLVLLSDGDNVYFGQNVYQASPASPNSFSIDGTTYPCQPPNTCSGWGMPCHTGTFSGSGVTIASDGFDANSWTGGTGWSGNWTTGGSTATTQSSGTPQSGADHARLANTGSIYRKLDLSTYDAASLTFYAKTAGSWTSSNHGYLEISTNGSSWTQLIDFKTSNTGTSYPSSAQSVDLSDYTGNSNVYIRFRADTGSTTKYLYIDTVTVTNTSSDGYLNGQDGQDYTSCNETPVARERQLDVETLNMANAIKAQDVEIFVVVFSACPDNTGTTVFDSTACGSQANPVSTAPSSGKVGDTTNESTANTRLVKCIASSRPGTNDHYFYANSATDLPNIFTTIAATIAHRLVE